MDKKLREKLTKCISETLDKSKVLQYEMIEMEDDEDINFFITPKLKTLKKRDNKLNFILYCSDETTLTIYCPTLYRLKDKDSVMFTLNAINSVNAKIAVGKIYMNDSNGSVISYINRILYDNILEELNVDVLEDYIKSFWITAIELYEQMRMLDNDENK